MSLSRLGSKSTENCLPEFKNLFSGLEGLIVRKLDDMWFRCEKRLVYVDLGVDVD